MKMTANYKRWLLVGIGASSLLALIYVVAVPRPVTVDQAIVERGTFREMIKVDGIMRSKDRYIVPAFADGDIKRVELKSGDPVKKGQAITELFWDVRYEPVRSPIAGVVSRVFRESAGPIARGEPIVEVIDPARLEIMAEMLTTDATRVLVGSPALVEGWGGPDAIKARVVRISKAGFTKQSALGVEEEKTEVILDPIELPADLLSRLGSTFHVDVAIQVSRTENALKIPVGAIFKDGAEWSVYRIEAGHARKVRVDLGARGNQEVVVRSGLSEGDRVVLYPGDLVKDGARIRAHSASSSNEPSR